MDPIVVAAIVNASGGLLQKILELAGRRDSGDVAKKVVDKTYEALANSITTNSLRVLIALLEEGSALVPEQVLRRAAALSKSQEPDGRAYENELTYRLKFLSQWGLVQPVGSEFAITKLGAAFVKKARDDDQRYSRAFRQLRA
jgi:hypothetical protein